MIGNYDRHEKNPFRSDRGQIKTLALFLEIRWDLDGALYTLEDQDREYKGKTYPSLKRLYLECEDPTEYEFANQYLENWQHWERMQRSPILIKHIEQWRDELEIRLRSKAIKGIIQEAKSDGRSAFQAQKWLADRSWDKRKAGAPSKDEKQRQLKIGEHIASELEEDLNRMSEYH